MNFSEVLKKIPTPQVSMPQMPSIPKFNAASGHEELGKPPINMTQCHRINGWYTKSDAGLLDNEAKSENLRQTISLWSEMLF
ncbi:unnamed protein product [Echinostoma caproni]|uniref:Uncharacterized protein n=1 Tax=Echinostoma caproni TaxID=27848 RepID=A0A183AV40_9TREM|nr:unnamed protein product [Echinostoma caproni]